MVSNFFYAFSFRCFASGSGIFLALFFSNLNKSVFTQKIKQLNLIWTLYYLISEFLCDESARQNSTCSFDLPAILSVN